MSSGTGDPGPSGVDEETADEVKVFRSNATEEDPSELAGSSAELDADKHELAMEAEIESQGNIGQSFNTLINNPLAGPLPWPTPGSNFVFGQLLAASLSPVYGPTIQKMATAMAAQQLYTGLCTAAFVARHSPNYANLGAAANGAGTPFGGANSFERPPNFSLSQPCTPSTAQRNPPGNAFMASQNSNGTGQNQLNSPMSTLGGVLGGMRLGGMTPMTGNKAPGATPSMSGMQQHQMRTPKREKQERKEKNHHQHSHPHREDDSKKDHIKKPMNAFMLFMKANRHKYLEESADKRKQSAELNKELGQIWQQMSRDAQQPYYDMAQKAKEEHARMHPQWSARENYAIHKRAKKKRVREKSADNNEQKKCRARYGVDNQAKWCKHCRRKKRCLNVLRDSDSPVQVSSTTNPTTPLSSTNQFNAPPFTSDLFGLSSSAGIHSHHLDSPHSSCGTAPRKDCREGAGGAPSSSTNNSERTTTESRCSSVESSESFAESNGSEMMVVEGAGGREDGEEQLKMEIMDRTMVEDRDREKVKSAKSEEAGAAATQTMTNSNGTEQHRTPQQQQHFQNPTSSSSSAMLVDVPKPPSGMHHHQTAGPSAFQMNSAFPFPPNFPQNPFIPFGRFGFS